MAIMLLSRHLAGGGNKRNAPGIIKPHPIEQRYAIFFKNNLHSYKNSNVYKIMKKQ